MYVYSYSYGKEKARKTKSDEEGKHVKVHANVAMPLEFAAF